MGAHNITLTTCLALTDNWMKQVKIIYFSLLFLHEMVHLLTKQATSAIRQSCTLDKTISG